MKTLMVVLLAAVSSCASAEKGGVLSCRTERHRKVIICVDEGGNVVEVPTAKPMPRATP